MLLDKLQKYRVVLASQSPRRKELLKSMGIDFEVCQSKCEEVISSSWTPEEAVQHLALQKAENVFSRLCSDETISRPLMVIGGDTIVVQDGLILGKPHNRSEAQKMLESLSGRKHYVHSGICVFSSRKQLKCCDTTEVTFSYLSQDEISYYLDQYRPYDKAGAYGIQDWIGHIGISSIKGSFYGVMGLPTFSLWSLINEILD